MRIALTPESEEFVAQQVREGKFPDASAVVNQALEVLRIRDQAAVEELRRDIRVGIEQLDRGEGRPWSADEAKREWRERKSREAAS